MEGEIIARFWKAVMKSIDDGQRASEIHVTDLVYDCIRRSWYDKQVGDVVSDPKGIMAVWIGRMLHEMPVCDEHEVELKYTTPSGIEITGRMDELCVIDGDVVIIDKKTTRQIPGKPLDHHVKQLLYYAYMLWKVRGVRASKIAVLYIDVSSLEVKPYIIPINQIMIESAGREMEEKAVVLSESLRSGIPPRRQVGWWCSYCSMFRRCFSE
ncbi:MAG: PD-(D/E)XK nuclease family protein [Candidatus Nezhaarchaeales archaeon]